MQNITTRVAQVFWGLAIIGVDFHIRRFDLVPDFAGYVLVALGTAGLVGWSSHFQLARLLSWILVPVSVTLMVFNGGLLKLSWFLTVALDGALMWVLLGGVMEFAEYKLHPEWVTRASICRRVYLGLLGAGLFIAWLAPELPTLARVLGGATRFGMLLVFVVVLHLLYLLKGEATSVSQSQTPETPEKGQEAA